MRWWIGVGMLLAAGCGTSGPAAAPAPVVPLEEVTAVATQTRTDQAAGGRFQITVTNTGAAPYTVDSVQLDSPGFESAPASPRDDPFPPGVRYDLPAAYGDVRCETPPVPATAVVRLHREGGPTGEVRVPLDSSDGLLQLIHDRECAAQELARLVRVSVLDLRDGGPGVLAATLRVERGDTAEPIALSELRGGVLYTLTAPLPARLEAGKDRLDLPLEVRPSGCSGHLLGEVKQPYLYQLFVQVGAGEVSSVEVPTDDGQRRQLFAFVKATCGIG